MSKYLTIILTLFFLHSFGQKEQTIDSIAIEKSTDFLNNKLGKEFTKENLEFYGIYNKSRRFVTYKIKNCISKDIKNIVGVIVDNSLNIDTNLSSINKIDILNCIQGKESSNLYMDTTQAIAIAGKYVDLKKYKYRIYFVFYGSKTFDPRWVVETRHYENVYGYGQGDDFSINARTGIYELGIWTRQP